ncbi:hypothetical protein Taro_014842, partial [Colocasia esculenta]|nr:hypothetical protein [Colocasia esculenta]
PLSPLSAPLQRAQKKRNPQKGCSFRGESMASSSANPSSASAGAGYDIPWVEKYRPTKVSDVVGNTDAVSRLQVIAHEGNMPNLILSGPPGTGKTTSILALAHELLGPNFKEAGD